MGINTAEQILDRHYKYLAEKYNDALSFTQRKDVRYNKILIKEAVHYFDDRISKWKGIYG